MTRCHSYLRLCNILFIHTHTHTHMYHIFFIHPSADGHSGCFHSLPAVNSAAMKVGVHVRFWISVFVFFGKIPRSGISGLYGRPNFIFLRRLHTVFISGCTDLHSHRQSRGVPFSPRPHQRSLFAVSRSDRCETGPHRGFDLHFPEV